ncbi:hypothetical protein Tco_1395817 [Tanacetum coccineum]
MDACDNEKDTLDRVKRLMQGTELSKIERESWFLNDVDKFTSEAKESLSSLEWNKYVTNVHLSKNLVEDSYDALFDHLQQYEGIVNASRAKRAVKIHDALALDANTYASSSSSQSQAAYYVTNPPSVIDYDDVYKEKNQSVVQVDRVDIQRINLGNGGRYVRKMTVNQGESAENRNVHKDTENGNVQRILPTIANPGNSKYFLEQMLLGNKDEARIILTNEHNDFLLADVSEIEEF